MKTGSSTTDKALIEDGIGPTTGSGYEPIVGVPPIPDGLGDLGGATTYSVSFSAIETTSGASLAQKKQKTVAFQIRITGLIQQNIDIDGEWNTITSEELPFDVDGIIVGENHEIGKNEQFEIVIGMNTDYDGGYPVQLVIVFTMHDKTGADPQSGTFAIKHPPTA